MSPLCMFTISTVMMTEYSKDFTGREGNGSAPSHDEENQSNKEESLNPYLGSCRVVEPLSGASAVLSGLQPHLWHNHSLSLLSATGADRLMLSPEDLCLPYGIFHNES